MKYILILMLLSTSAFASGDRTDTTNIYNTSIEDARGVAIAIASSQHHFEYDTYSWQGSVGVGMYKGEEAIAIAITGLSISGNIYQASTVVESKVDSEPVKPIIIKKTIVKKTIVNSCGEHEEEYHK